MGGLGNPSTATKQADGDRDLVDRARRGDRDAFCALVRRHQDLAFNRAYQIMRNREDALDISQEAFARAYSSLPTFKGEATFTTWLHRIVVNLAIDSLRRRQRGGIGASVEFQPEDRCADVISAADPVSILQSKQVRALLAQGIERLPPAQRAVLILREIEGMSYDAIAQAVGCTLGTVMSRLYYGRRKLQEVLKRYLEDLR